jgi:ribulose-phosphate 3-epimerase
MERSVRICPSVLNADHNHLFDEIAKVAKQSDLLHLDIMDNIFVPNKTFSFEESKEIISKSQLPVDAHLMIHNPDEIAVEYAKASCHSVTFHIEASKNPTDTISKIHEYGSRAALALKPKTPFEAVLPYLEDLDMILIMTVEPGFGGQKFMEEMMSKVEFARMELDKRDLAKIWLQVDGGISLETISKAYIAGADTFVAGSAVFQSTNPGAMCSNLRARALSSQLK